MYSKTTKKINITVKPYYLEDQSEPEDQHYVWAYKVIIDNQGKEKIKKFLNNYGSVINEYLVVGHTDTKGTNKYNLSLSIKRAEVVKEILINYGFNQSSIKILGKGEETLAVDTPDDTKQPANRRVEIKKTN